MTVMFIKSKGTNNGISHLSTINEKTGKVACSSNCITKYYNNIEEFDTVETVEEYYQKDPVRDVMTSREISLLINSEL